ncbi:MAG: hypothetical protein VX229_10840 [Pseudomonadota bacterium]|nr:hypothetical protein [uncultured Halomonas sp.]MEE3269301.1 hypothetical protein [Pseudomonadota bacterium]
MFTYLRRRALIAGVAAEIKAQCKNQEFVQQVCFTPSGMYTIAELGEKRFTEKGKLRYFMIATFLLADTICTYDIPLSVKTACLELLHDRRAKIEHHMNGGYGPVTLEQKDVDDLDEITDVGIQMLSVERREAMMKNTERETGMDLS